jgi:hypothetical protein
MNPPSPPERPLTVAHAAPTDSSRFVVAVADERDREQIAVLRHDVYARELGQHAVNAAGRLSDPLDAWNVNLVVKVGGELAGFVSLTPPARPSYSIDKYFARSALPFAVDDRLFEVRLLTVVKRHRGRELHSLLMYAALRWTETHGGTRIVVLGRHEIVGLYLHVGLRPTGLAVQSGAVTYDLLLATVEELRSHGVIPGGVVERLAACTDWHLPFPFWRLTPCFHDGAYFAAATSGQLAARAEAAMTKRAIVLNGANGDDDDLMLAYKVLAEELVALKCQVKPFLLRDLKIHYCSGCFDCWVRTPGLCTIDDDARVIARAMMQSDLVVLLSPVSFGGYSAELKRALDRILGIVLPFFVKHNGETHHGRRYKRYPRLLGLGVLPGPEQESAPIFKALVGRNALNFHAPAWAAAAIPNGKPENEIRSEVRGLLSAMEMKA